MTINPEKYQPMLIMMRLMFCVKTVSITSMSYVNRFSNLPMGVASKYEIGASNTRDSIDAKIDRATRAPPLTEIEGCEEKNWINGREDNGLLGKRKNVPAQTDLTAEDSEASIKRRRQDESLLHESIQRTLHRSQRKILR